MEGCHKTADGQWWIDLGRKQGMRRKGLSSNKDGRTSKCLFVVLRNKDMLAVLLNKCRTAGETI